MDLVLAGVLLVVGQILGALGINLNPILGSRKSDRQLKVISSVELIYQLTVSSVDSSAVSSVKGPQISFLLIYPYTWRDNRYH